MTEVKDVGERAAGLPGSCSVTWDRDDLPAWGSAMRADFLVGVQQEGPWGARVFTESRMDPTVGAALEAAAADAGGRAVLLRRIGVPAEGDPGDAVLISGGWGNAPWVIAGRVADPAELLELPWADLAGPTPVDFPGFVPLRAALLVCTNSKRDVCCAVRGRPLAVACAQARPGDVWEASHLSGHRFAPTAVVLPTGQSLGRMTVELGLEALDAAAEGRLVAPGRFQDRGRCALEPSAQAADAAVRALTGENRVGDLGVTVGDDAHVVLHADGRLWSVDVTGRTEVMAESCGKDAVSSTVWEASVRPSLTLNRPGAAG